MAQQFTAIQVNGDPIMNGSLTAGILETVIIVDDDAFLEPSTTDTGNQYSIGGTNFTSSAYPGFTGTGVEIYSATVNGQPATFGYLSAAADLADDAVDRIVVLSGTINPGDSITGITLINGGNTNIAYNAIPSTVCFTKGTIIETPSGSEAIETLQIDDLVVTADNGLQPIRWIGAKTITEPQLLAQPHLRPIRIKAHALGHNLPEQDLLVSPQHRMFLSSPRAHIMFGHSEVLVTAKSLVNDTTILVDHNIRQVDYIHILFDHHELVRANQAWSESFHPGAVGLSAIEEGLKNELLEIFPHLREDPNSFGQSARHSLKAYEAKVLFDHLGPENMDGI